MGVDFSLSGRGVADKSCHNYVTMVTMVQYAAEFSEQDFVGEMKKQADMLNSCTFDKYTGSNYEITPREVHAAPRQPRSPLGLHAEGPRQEPLP